MTAKVFISYRREDTKWPAQQVYEAFVRVLPREDVFMDVDSIPPGADFVEFLEGWVNQCEILLALIGPGWFSATDPKTGGRRLDNSDDFVRIEVREALSRGIPVVPVLVDGAPMPDPDQLPKDMKKLVRRQAEFVQFRTFDADVERLIRKLRLDANARPAASPAGTARSSRSQTVEDRMRAEGRVKVLINSPGSEQVRWIMAGGGKDDAEMFQDIAGGPEMVVVPAATFIMGSPESEPEREHWQKGMESPHHNVMIAKPFAVGRHAVTRKQFSAFVSATGHKGDGADVYTGSEFKHDPKASWRNPGFAQNDSHPVVCVRWDDAKAYAAWLADETGKPYRLLTEAEWEYVARAGITTPFWWGSSITPAQANYDGNYVYAGGGGKGENRKGTVPVGSFAVNPWGLYNVHGNVWELCEDVWHDNYRGAPQDGSRARDREGSWGVAVSAWLQSGDARVIRGGSWFESPGFLRAACRNWARGRASSVGFRLGRTLTP